MIQLSSEKLVLPVIDWSNRSRRYLNTGEMEVLIALVESVQPRSVLEFGVNVGRTAQALLEYCPTIERYLGIDVPHGFTTALRVQRGEVPHWPGHLVESDSRFTLLLPANGSHGLRGDELFPADAVFIDGDHSYSGVMNDTRLALEVIRPGGIIIWHDLNDEPTIEVRKALNDLSEHGMAIQHIEGTWLAFHRIPA